MKIPQIFKLRKLWGTVAPPMMLSLGRCVIKQILLHGICQANQEPGGGTRMARGGIRLVHRFTKSTLITYHSGMKKDPKYAFLHAFFFICMSCSFQNLSIWPKTPFFPILHVFAPLNDVRAYSALSWKTTLITWIFGRAWYPPWHPGPGVSPVIYINCSTVEHYHDYCWQTYFPIQSCYSLEQTSCWCVI